MKKFFWMLVPLLISLNTVRAADNIGGMFLEPLVSYETGTGNINFPSPINDSDSKVKGFGVGAKFGVHLFDIFFAGVDGRYSWPKLKDSTLDQDVTSKSWNWGPTAGVQMPWIVGLRVWATWILGGELNPDKDKGVDEKFKSANGYRLGAGFRVAMVSLNAEYQYVKYDKTEIDQVGVFNTGFNTGDIFLKNKSFIASVSFPIGL